RIGFQLRLPESASFGSEPRFKSCSAIAIVAGPVLSAVQIAAAAARMCALNLQEIEILFPVLTLFQKRCGAITNLDPLYASILKLPRFGHVPKILVSRYRSPTKRFVLDR